MRDVFFLTCGAMHAPGIAFRPRDAHAVLPVTLSNTVMVAVRDDGDVALVDVGWSSEACAHPESLGRVYRATLGVRVQRGDAIVDQLAALGIRAARVKTIVATHLHLDHVGGVCDFPDAEVVTTARELAAYRRFPHALGYRAADLARAGRIHALSLSGPPAWGFPASADVFDDGTLVLLDARGHTSGSLAVAVNGPRGPFVHIGDAAYLRWEYGLAPRGPSLVARVSAWKNEEQAKTYACVRACEADPRRPTVVPAHDLDVFQSLPQRPISRPSSAP